MTTLSAKLPRPRLAFCSDPEPVDKLPVGQKSPVAVWPGCERSSLNFVLFLNPFSARDALVGGRIRRNGIYGRFAGIAGSIRFNARELHHFGRLFGFLGEELTEVGG